MPLLPKRGASLTVLLAVLLSAAAVQSREPPRAARIDLDLHQADIRHVLRLLSDVGRVNFVLAEGVSGTISVHLVDVSWRDALEAILSSRGLEMERRGSIVLVAPAKLFAQQRASRITQYQQCLKVAPLQTRLVRYSYARAESMAPLVSARLTPRGSVAVDARTNTLLVRDVACQP